MPSREAEVEIALDCRAVNGESPTWSVEEQALYWIDVKEPALHRFRSSTGEDEAWPLPSDVGAFALCRSGRVLAALRTGLMLLDLSEGTSKLVLPAPYGPRTHRFNDGKVDAHGRFWIGTMCEPSEGEADSVADGARAGPLYRFDSRNGIAPTGAAAVIGNGLAWSPDERRLYFADTEAGEISCFDFDADTGAISNGRRFISFPPAQGKPDGAAVDREGCYWVALFGGGRVIRIRPDGTLNRTISLPVTQPTMCGFGGPDLDILYITTARAGLSESQLAREPLAGGIFQCRPGVHGMPTNRFAD